MKMLLRSSFLVAFLLIAACTQSESPASTSIPVSTSTEPTEIPEGDETTFAEPTQVPAGDETTSVEPTQISEGDDSTASSQGPNIIFHNANIITMEETQPEASAIAIAGETILAVGSDVEVLPLANAQTQIVDLNGLTMTPGFIDSHGHRITQRDRWGFATVQEAIEDVLPQGWTGLHELAVDENQLAEMIAADAAGELSARVNVYLLVNTFSGEPLGDWYQAYRQNQEISSYLRVAGLKIFIDFDSGQTLLWEQDDLNQFVSARMSEGWQISMKAISIQAHELALRAYAHALDGEANENYRPRIEHSGAASGAQMAWMAQLHVTAAIQPSFPGVIWNLEDARYLVDNEGMDNVWRRRDYLNAGVFMVASPFNPRGDSEYFDASHISAMGLVYRSVTQIGLGGAQPESWMLDQTLTVDELLPMLTINGAYATFEEGRKGSLAPGKWADLVILSENPLQTPEDAIRDIQVLMTMVGGAVKYCANEQGATCFPPGNSAAPGFALAVGNWMATDSDGSSMTLEIIHNSDSEFSMVLNDDGATVCGLGSDGENLLAQTAEASGTAVGFALSLFDGVSVCAETNETRMFDFSFTYDPDSDSLIDSSSIVWRRQ